MKRDRAVVHRFVHRYARVFDLPVRLKQVPEEDRSTPADQRIEAIYEVGRGAVHVEHTSFDIFHSGATPKRELDEGFKDLETVLKEADFPSHQGLVVLVSMKVFANRKKLHAYFDAIVHGVKAFLGRLGKDLVNHEPYKFTTLPCGEIQLSVCLDPLLEGKISLEYIASDENRYGSSELMEIYESAFAKKIAKLKRSVRHHGGGAIGLLLIENHDVAAQCPLVFDRMFSEILWGSSEGCDEVWLLRGGSLSLLWLRDFELLFGDGRAVDLSTPESVLFHRDERWRVWRKIRGEMLCDNVATEESCGAL